MCLIYLLVLSLLELIIISNVQGCGDPPVIPNGWRSYPNTNVGATATYYCNSGYSGSGDNTITCTHLSWIYSYWETLNYSCKIKNCGTPPSVSNAGRSYSSTTYGSRVTYSCKTGYTASGTPYITCPSSGYWPTPSYICRIKDCGTPTPVSNADQFYSSTTYNSVVNYICNHGYTASGNDIITCLSDGNWSLVTYLCTIVDCGMPPNISYAVALVNETTYGTYVNYSCVYSVDDDYVYHAICDATGNWNHPALNCSDLPERLEQEEQDILMITILPTAVGVMAIALGVTLVWIIRKKRLGKSPPEFGNQMVKARISATPTETSNNQYEDIAPINETGKLGQTCISSKENKVGKNVNSKNFTDRDAYADRDIKMRYEKARGKVHKNTTLNSNDQNSDVTSTGNVYENLFLKSCRISNADPNEPDEYENTSLRTKNSNPKSVGKCEGEEGPFQGIQREIAETNENAYINLTFH